MNQTGYETVVCSQNITLKLTRMTTLKQVSCINAESDIKNVLRFVIITAVWSVY